MRGAPEAGSRIWNKTDKAQIIYCFIEALRANGKRVGMWRDQVGKFFKDGHSSRLVFWKPPNGGRNWPRQETDSSADQAMLDRLRS